MHSAKSFFSNQDFENAHFIEALGYLWNNREEKINIQNVLWYTYKNQGKYKENRPRNRPIFVQIEQLRQL